MVTEYIFWLSVLLLAYTYFCYPLLIRLCAGLFRRAPARRQIEPDLSILVVVHNEAARLKDKIENLLALDYPRGRCEIVIASDGSTDGTEAVARAYRESGVRLMAFSQRRGKPAVLNEVVPHLRGEIAVLMDVRQRVEPGALRALVRNFADPRVGAVSGELMLEADGDSEVGEGVGFYWRYEKFIRQSEAQVDSTVGVTGAIYALRRRLFRPIPSATLLDDVLIPMQVVRQGYRVLFEPAARAWDRASVTAAEEFTRKVRTIAGNFQLLFREPWMLNPFNNRLWFQTLSHKYFRLAGPFCLGAALLSNLLLVEQAPVYRVALALQVFFYSCAAAGLLIRNPREKTAIMKICSAFCLLNWATVVGFLRFLSGRQQVTWQKAKAQGR